MIKNKNTSWPCIRGIPVYSAVALLCVFSFVLLSTLQVNAIKSDIARWYSSDEQLSSGQVVAVLPEKGDYVQSATLSSATRILGVVVAEKESLLSIDEREDAVPVVIAGRAEANVNGSNGPISRGDLIGLSDESGTGAKAKDGQPVVGVAETSFGEEGEDSSAKSGKIPIIVSVGVAPSVLGDSGASSTTWLKNIAGRDVSALQLAFVFFIAAVGIISIIVLSYSSIRSGVVAVGRNPLARPAILRALSQAMIMVSIVATLSFSLMYLMLRL